METEVATTEKIETCGEKTPEITTKLHAVRHEKQTGLDMYDLATALQYGQGTGSAQLLKFLTEHVQVSRPLKRSFENCQVLLLTWD